jgi:type IV pilus assembly protein PilN
LAHPPHINLASEPFQRDRAMIAASVLVALLMCAALALQIFLIRSERDQMADTHDAIDRAEAQLRQLTAEQNKLQAVLRQPANAEVLERSVLLNTIIRRKGISWTRIFSDLEGVMPHNVRLISVRPEVNARHQISLTMVVGAQSPEPVLKMLTNLQSSQHFGGVAVQQWMPPSQTDPLYRYRVSVSYEQKL